MARFEPQEVVTQSVLDRLIDQDLETPSDPFISRAQSVRQLKASLKRDLEWLLNTRQIPDEAGDGRTEVEDSLYKYGLPDFSSLSVRSTADQNRLLRMLEGCVATFEPRLAGVRVSLDPASAGSRVLRFQIEGMLRIDPAPEKVSFDTVLELTSGEYEVKGG